jgi:hypothetical protein
MRISAFLAIAICVVSVTRAWFCIGHDLTHNNSYPYPFQWNFSIAFLYASLIALSMVAFAPALFTNLLNRAIAS